MGTQNSEAAEALTPLQLDLAQKILQHLRDEALPVGTRVSAPELARSFNVSRSPVGRALGLLVEEGVLRVTPSRRMEVARDVSKLEVPALAGPSPQEDLYKRIMRDRARGDLPREVSEAELIPRYGVSRGTIRKVLMRFAADGLAQRLQGHGWQFVESLHDAESLRESYHFRLIVECSAFRAPGYHADPARIDQIRRAHERILTLGRGAVTAEQWFGVNAGFHEAVAGFSGNRYLVSAVQHQNNLRRMREAALYEELSIRRIRVSCEEHLDVLAAIEEGNLEWAESLMREHLKKAGGL
ncbi:GntR family transcriptional regulator [Pseudoroseicyclus sp. CXY001]|uniref:GntR family transcriptional regulator n=1 Tax=Pseudoroseicyclus sp. CXY001 TaxID=3242492 RepID=UPI00358DB1B8